MRSRSGLGFRSESGKSGVTDACSAVTRFLTIMTLRSARWFSKGSYGLGFDLGVIPGGRFGTRGVFIPVIHQDDELFVSPSGEVPPGGGGGNCCSISCRAAWMRSSS